MLPAVHRPLVTFATALLTLTITSGCGTSPAPRPPPSLHATPHRAPSYPIDDASWGRYHSRRFLLSVPLPDGKSWRIDDHSHPFLLAVHEPTSSQVAILTTQEDDLMNRQKCE